MDRLWLLLPCNLTAVRQLSQPSGIGRHQAHRCAQGIASVRLQNQSPESMGTAALVWNSAQAAAPAHSSTVMALSRRWRRLRFTSHFPQKGFKPTCPISSERILWRAVRGCKSEHQSGAKQTVTGAPKFLSLSCSLSMYFDQRLFNTVFSFMIVICILWVTWGKHVSLPMVLAKWGFSYGSSEKV